MVKKKVKICNRGHKYQGSGPCPICWPSSKQNMQSPKVTHRINAKAFELLKQYPEGLRWSELLSKIKASDPTFHPKTVNGCVWKLVERFPDKVYKPSKGLFRLLKYKSAKEQ